MHPPKANNVASHALQQGKGNKVDTDFLNMPKSRTWAALLASACLMMGQAHAQMSSCFLTAPNGISTPLQDTSQPRDTLFSITLACRGSGSAFYEIDADLGSQGSSSSPFRNLRLAIGPIRHDLAYALQRRTAPSGPAVCSDTSNWVPGAPISGVVSVSSGSSLGVTFTPICLRILGTPRIPPVGIYQDTLNITARVGSNITVRRSIPLQASVDSSCGVQVLGPLNLDYRSFQAQDTSNAITAQLSCNLGLPWAANIDTLNNGTVLGLNYAVSLSNAQGTGTGLAQNIAINGRVAAGQSGACNRPTCRAIVPHTLVITY